MIKSRLQAVADKVEKQMLLELDEKYIEGTIVVKWDKWANFQDLVFELLGEVDRRENPNE